MVTQVLSCHHQEAACISSAITALLSLHRGSKYTPPAKLPAPDALTGYYKVQSLTQKGYILMKLEEYRDLLHTWLFTNFLVFTELNLLG